MAGGDIVDSVEIGKDKGSVTDDACADVTPGPLMSVPGVVSEPSHANGESSQVVVRIVGHRRRNQRVDLLVESGPLNSGILEWRAKDDFQNTQLG